jgi:uncharacterized protein Yka (UPF0111/DUF47 family)
MEFNKIDFAKLFDTTVAIDNMHKSVTNMITYMPEQMRDSVRTVADAQFGLIRSTSKAVTQFAEVVESVSKEAQKEIAKTIEKTTKVAA